MFKKVILATLATVLISCQTTAPIGDSGQVIFGTTDDRHDWYEINDLDAFLNARSVVSLWQEWQVQDLHNDTYSLWTSPFGERFDMCEGTRFEDQPIGAFCSGFLVGDDIIVTAGHCVEQFINNPDKIVFVFDYKMTSKDIAKTVIPQDDVYFGKEIISWKLENRGDDYAIVRLDRPVVNRDPLTVSREKVGWRDSVYMLGHPSGLPMKYTDNAKVTKNWPTEYFEADLDAFGGNSGSAVFNDDGEVVGILVRGWSDFTRNNRKGCNECRVILSTTEHEEITRSTRWVDLIPED